MSERTKEAVRDMGKRYKKYARYWGLILTLSAAFVLLSAAADAAGFASTVVAELERRGDGRDLVKVSDTHANITVFYDTGAYDAVYRTLGDEAFAEWFGALSLDGADKRDMVAVVLTNQRMDGISSPKIFGHKFGFMETEGVILMTPSCMYVFDDPWGTVGQYLGRSDRVDYAYANIGDDGTAFIVGKRRYKNGAFTSLLVEMKRAANGR